jgi:hypothetical protein
VKPKTNIHHQRARQRMRHAQDQADAPRGFQALQWQADPTRYLQLTQRDAGDSDGEETKQQ